MKVFVDNRAGENMCLIEVENSDTVLAIKEKIKRLLRFHVSNQFLYFNDKFLFHNNVRAEQLKIGPNSHLQLYVPPPTHSPAPSNSTKQISHVQDSPVMVRTNQEQPLTTNEIPNSQDSPVMVRRNKNESLSLGKKEELLGIQDSFPTVQSPEASEIFKELNIPNLSSVMNMPSLRPEIITQQMSHVQDSTEQLWTTEESDFVNEIINIPDSPAKKKIKTIPRKLILMVKPSEESRSIPLEVNESDDVIELRKELFKMQERGELNLPQQGFYLMRNLTILDETQSFKENRLTQGDTIEIYGEYFTSDDDSTTTSV